MFKPANVVMLPTENKVMIGDYIISLIGNKLFSGIKVRESDVQEINQHLYITSDKKIKDSEIGIPYCITWANGKSEVFCSNNRISDSRKLVAKRIIATTNSQYKSLPQLSKQFIQQYIVEYNKSNASIKVEVEYEDNGEEGWSGSNEDGEPIWIEKFQLKVNPDNTINIKPIKDSWSKEEVIRLCEIAYFNGNNNIQFTMFKNDFNKWSEQNL